MRFGYFDDPAREYVITTPRTPYPWINYLGNEEFFGLVSHLAGGYCFYRDARLRRVLRYRYNGVPTDAGGRTFYVRDGEDFWTPAWAPVKSDLEHYECRHGLGYTRICGRRGGVRAELLFLVPPGANVEIHQVTLRNESGRRKHLRLFSLVEFCLWNAWDDQTNLQRNLSTGEVEIEGSTIYHTTEYRERRNHYAFYGVNAPLVGFDTDRESFLGTYNGLHEPQVVQSGEPRNSVASGWQPIGSHALDADLSPGEERAFVFVLGYVENPPERKWERPGVVEKGPARALLARFGSARKVAEAMETLRDSWEVLLSTFRLRSTDERLDRMVNIWNPYQCMVTFNLSRSASYFETGIGRGMGFRDSNQDLLGSVHQVPERARERILDLASTQLPDGSAYHQYQPLTKRGNHDLGTGFGDDPLWLVLAVAAYTKETGDYAILDELVPFDNDEGARAPLLDHLRRSFHHLLANLGPHGLPLIGRADWNDCLNLNCFSELPDEPFQTTGQKAGRTAESVMIAGMLAAIGPEWVRLLELKGLNSEANRARSSVETMRSAILEHGWDGQWFLRAYDASGRKVGSHECGEGKIFIESQGWCVMGGAGLDTGEARLALDAVRAHLDTPYGIMLVQPAFRSYRVELGEISSYPPGYKENAGIFCHNNPWIAIAETMIGRPERAYETYRKIAPAWVEEVSEIHRTEPYVYSQVVAGKDAARYGEAKNAWLTGTAAWNFVAVTQHLLGIRPEHEGLRIHPCLPASLPRLTVTRRCRGATYVIHVENSGACKEARLTVDGRAVDRDIVPWAGPGAVVEVECRI